LQGLLQGPHEQVAFGPVIENYSQPGVQFALLVGERLLHPRDIGFLAAEDVEPTRCDLGFALEPPRLPQARAELLLNLLEQGLEAVEVLASLAIGDLLGRPLLRNRPDMPELGDVGRGGAVHSELCQELVIVELFESAERGRLRAREEP